VELRARRRGDGGAAASARADSAFAREAPTSSCRSRRAGDGGVAGEAQALGVKALGVRTDVTELPSAGLARAPSRRSAGAGPLQQRGRGRVGALRRPRIYWAVGLASTSGGHPRRRGFVPRNDRAREPAQHRQHRVDGRLIASKVSASTTLEVRGGRLSETLVKDLKPYRIACRALSAGVRRASATPSATGPCLRNERTDGGSRELMGRSLSRRAWPTWCWPRSGRTALYVIITTRASSRCAAV